MHRFLAKNGRQIQPVYFSNPLSSFAVDCLNYLLSSLVLNSPVSNSLEQGGNYIVTL